MPSVDSFSYYSSFTLEQNEGLRHVYNLDTLSFSNDFTESELLSLKFQDIYEKYPASREMSRENIYFMNTIIKNIAEKEGGVNRGTYVQTMNIIFSKALTMFQSLSTITNNNRHCLPKATSA